MLGRHGISRSRRLFVWFVATTIVPALGLGWLGWQLVQQDRRLDSQRLQEKRDQAAELAVAALQRTLAELEGRVATIDAAPRLSSDTVPEGVAVIALGPHGVLERAGTLLPFGPVAPTDMPRVDEFAPADALEFQKHDFAAAIHFLRTFTANARSDVRAEALLRMGRNYRKLGDPAHALEAFAQLTALDRALAGGLPAGLQGHQGRAKIFAEMNRQADLVQEASQLDRELSAGRWPLSRSQYQFSVDQTRAWLGDHASPPIDPESLALAAATEVVWNEWRATDGANASVPRRRMLWVAERSVLALTRESPERLLVLLVGPRFLDQAWRRAVQATSGDSRIDFALTDAEGHAVLGRANSPVSSQSVRTASATELPWTVHAVSTVTNATAAGLSGPARLMLAAVLTMTVVVLAGGFFINRAIARELAVARLQSDFVAAVSHEFRTPLTTIRQLSEMLVRARVSTSERRQQFYETLLHESERLHRLVESLLNFAHLESGELQYRFEALDATDFLREIVAEFQDEVSRLGYHIEFAGDDHVLTIRADRELLARVFWNLLDNAVKYSPENRTVRVEVTHRGGQLFVCVRDQGLGIPRSEQREIFRKFVRGAAPKAATIKGTGIGLAMAREIVDAHGAEIRVESEPGRGSTFTVVLRILAPDSGLQAPANTPGAPDSRLRTPATNDDTSDNVLAIRATMSHAQAWSPEPEARSRPEARSLKPGA